jgi:hypothetical protein
LAAGCLSDLRAGGTVEGMRLRKGLGLTIACGGLRHFGTTPRPPHPSGFALALASRLCRLRSLAGGFGRGRVGAPTLSPPIFIVVLAVFAGCGDKQSTGVDGPVVCTTPTCNVDFPCSPEQKAACVWQDPTSIYRHETWSCERVCGTPCCSGAVCKGTTQSCPAGTLCANPTAPTSNLSATAECIDEARTCGGAANKQCASGEYCEHPETLCTGSSCPSATSVCDGITAGGLGICTVLPASSECTATDPVCGCNGLTYKDECARKAANAARAHKGACS